MNGRVQQKLVVLDLSSDACMPLVNFPAPISALLHHAISDIVSY